MSRETMDLFFNPRSVAVIGASTKPEKLGHQVALNFIRNKKRGVFRGEVFLINPRGGEIDGFKVYRSISEVKRIIDHVVIIIPARFVPSVLEECGRRGVKVATIISAGFSEIGNIELEEELKRIADKYGVRVIGPNCLGVFSPYTGVDHLFLPEYKTAGSGSVLVNAPRPKRGYISLISQSGAFGNAALDYMSGVNIGISKFVSYGNRVDVDETTLMDYLSDDETTRAIMVYIESVGDGRRFMEVAGKTTLRKPIVIFKSGRTKAGARAAASHTAALAGVDEIYEAAFKQSGCIRAETMEEFFDVAKALAYQPPAKGGNVAILTDGGGAGVMAADACELVGLNVLELPEDLRRKFEDLKGEGVVPEFATTGNPVDLTGSATDEAYVKSADLLISHDLIHSLIIIALHHPPTLSDRFIDGVVDVVKRFKKPVAAVDIGMAEFSRYVRRKFEDHRIPAYPSPERAVKAIKALTEYGLYLAKNGVLDDHLKRWKPID